MGGRFEKPAMRSPPMKTKRDFCPKSTSSRKRWPPRRRKFVRDT